MPVDHSNASITHWLVMMTPRIRNLALTAHVITSVGWLGAVAVFLAIAVAGLVSKDSQMVRSAYLTMDLTAWSVIVPLSLASPITGIFQSLGTSWGLFRHYWIAVKFFITIPATAILLLHMQPIGFLGERAAGMSFAGSDYRDLRVQLIANAIAALVVLLIATTLSVYKPRGLTPYGRRKESSSAPSASAIAPAHAPNWTKIFASVVIALIVWFVIKHLTGGGFSHHMR